jgi:hypothetical protein
METVKRGKRGERGERRWQAGARGDGLIDPTTVSQETWSSAN